MPESSWISIHTDDRGVRACLIGSWVAAKLAHKHSWQQARAALSDVPENASWDFSQLQGLDHLGALLLWERWQQAWPRALTASDAQTAVLERVAGQEMPQAVVAGTSMLQSIDTLGKGVIHALRELRDFIALLGQLLLDALKLLLHPAQGPWRDFSGHLHRIGAQALAITALVGFLIGIVLAYLMSQVLRQFGAETFIVNILGLAILRELGPLLAAVLIAGRSGSAITAQIGVMRVTEELDAMRVLGIPIGFRLVLPRVMALSIAMPLIAVWTSFAALVGGVLASDLTLGITASYFIEALPKVVPFANLALAVGKSVVFGVFIALIACHYGLRIEPNTESLGRGTTASVVTSITAVILLDALFAIVFKSVGLS